MTTALITSRPTALESFQPSIQAVGTWGRSRPSIGASAQLTATMSPYTNQANYGETVELLKHFTYWNYVSIDLIATRCGEPTPMLSFKTKMSNKIAKAGGDKSKVTQSVAGDRRDWVASKYHVLQSAQDDLDPIPENHPLVKLIESPNDEDTWNQFVYEHFLFLKLTGEVYWWIIPNGFGLPAQVVVIPTQWVYPRVDANGFIFKYDIIPEGGSYRLLELPPEQVAHGVKKNPKDKRRGHSSLKAGALWIDNAEAIERSRNASFNQGVNPDVLLELGEKYADPTDSVLDRIKEKFIKRAGGVSRAGEPLITPPDVKATKWSNTPREMDYGTTGDSARDTNLALHGVPKVLLGITTDINRATIEGANVVLAENVLNPNLTQLAGMITKYLGKPFDERIVVWYEDITPKNQELELKKNQADFSMGAVTPDEIRQLRGRESIGEPAYESGYLPAGLHPISEEMGEIAAEAEAEAMRNEAEMLAAANESNGSNTSGNSPQGNGGASSAGGSAGNKKPAKAGDSAKAAKQSALPPLDEFFHDADN